MANFLWVSIIFWKVQNRDLFFENRKNKKKAPWVFMQRRSIPNLVEIRALESTLKSGRKAWEQQEDEESIPGSIFGHFLSLIKTELFGILTSGFLHRVLLPRINRLSKKKIHKMLGNIAKIGRQNRPFPCGIYSSFAAESPPEGGLGRRSLPRSLDKKLSLLHYPQ